MAVTMYVVGVTMLYLAIILVALITAVYAYRIYRVAGPYGGRDIMLTFSAFLVATGAASLFEIYETMGIGAFKSLETTYLMATVVSLTLFLVLSFTIKDGRI